jgi:two-component system chemotaxis sensor kinase CheA
VAAYCDAVVGEQSVVVKALGAVLEGTPGYLGAAILGDGTLALILDPAELARRLSSAPAAARATEKVAKGPAKVLVVDDQFTVRELQRSILEAAGYAVQTANDGAEALAVIERDGGIDMVVTDLEMPNVDGLGLLALIRSDRKQAELPVVVVTSKTSDEDRQRGLEAGADAYIVKHEFDQQALLDTVAHLVGR